MSNDSYSKTEVDLKFQILDQKMDTLIDNSEKTLEQAKETNGRVTAIEKWRAYLTGAVAIITLLGIPDVIALLSS